MIEPELVRYDPTVEVSVVIPTWNGREHLDICLASLLRQTAPRFEIIVVDNGSTDGTADWIQSAYGGAVSVIALERNLGFGTAVNAGIRAARGRYLFVLNNDTEVQAGCLAALVREADRYPNAGSLACRILCFDQRDRLDNAGHCLFPDGMTRGRGRLEPDGPPFDQAGEVFGASGCAALLRRAMLADIGLFDEDFFAYCEDADLALRARLAGWRCRYVPDAVVYHKYSASSHAYSRIKATLVERNRLWLAIKDLPGPVLMISPALTALRLAVQAWGALRGRGAAGRYVARYSRVDLLRTALRAWAQGLAGVPRQWRKRRVVQDRRRTTLADFTSWVRRFGIGVRELALKD